LKPQFSRCTVKVDAEQMEYLRYWKKLTGGGIVDTCGI
jgi:hypothetical protein